MANANEPILSLDLPVVFTTISNHYSGTYSSKYNWIILSVRVLAGWISAKIIRRAWTYIRRDELRESDSTFSF